MEYLSAYVTDKEIGLNDIIDLSVVELFILNYLVKIAASAVRFSVFNEINAQLTDNKVSRSSFYNSLQKLEKKGLVIIDDNPAGTGNVVSATPLARDAINQVNIFSIWGSVSPDTKIRSLIDKYGNRIFQNIVASQLFVSFDRFLHIPILDTISEYGTRNSFLASDEDYDKTNQQSTHDLHISRIEEGIIKEPDNFFDRVILYRYHPNALLYRNSGERIIEEAFRIVRPDCEIVIIGLDEIPKTNNLILESMVSDVLEEQLPSKISDDFAEFLVTDKYEITYNEVIQGIRFIKIKKT